MGLKLPNRSVANTHGHTETYTLVQLAIVISSTNAELRKKPKKREGKESKEDRALDHRR